MTKESQTKRSQMAKWSLFTGLISIPLWYFIFTSTVNFPLLLGLPIVMSLSGLILGQITLFRIKRGPEKFSGKNIARLGTFISATAFIIIVLGTCSVPNYLHDRAAERALLEAGPHLQTIAEAEKKYQELHNEYCSAPLNPREVGIEWADDTNWKALGWKPQDTRNECSCQYGVCVQTGHFIAVANCACPSILGPIYKGWQIDKTGKVGPLVEANKSYSQLFCLDK